MHEKTNKRKKKIKNAVFCEPSMCDHCIYIGEGDSMCDVTHEIVLADWMPTDAFMGEGCLYNKGGAE